MYRRAISISAAVTLMFALSGCGLLRDWYAAIVADSLALQASHSLGERRSGGTVTPANEGLGHLTLRAETWIDYRARTNGRSQQVAYVEPPQAPVGAARQHGMFLQLLDLPR